MLKEVSNKLELTTNDTHGTAALKGLLEGVAVGLAFLGLVGLIIDILKLVEKK